MRLNTISKKSFCFEKNIPRMYILHPRQAIFRLQAVISRASPDYCLPIPVTLVETVTKTSSCRNFWHHQIHQILLPINRL